MAENEQVVGNAIVMDARTIVVNPAGSLGVYVIDRWTGKVQLVNHTGTKELGKLEPIDK